MANEKFTQLPTVVSASLSDIIAAVQSGVSVQETLQQVFTLMLSNTILHNAGNPNGSVAGVVYQFCWDTSNHILYVCTTSGNAATAVWTVAGSLAIPVPIASGGTGVTSVTTAPTASAWAGWDANSNMSANNFLSGYATTATAAGTTVLTVGSKYQQFFTGVTTQTVTMPVTSTLVLGQSWYIVNNSSGVVTVQSSGGNTILAMPADTAAFFNCILTSGTTAASWDYQTFSQSSLVLPLSMLNGGTGAALVAANGAIPYSGASAMALLAPGSAGQLFRSGGAGAPTWSTATFPATGGAAGNVLISDGTNYISSTSIWPNTVGSAGKILRSDGTSNTYSTATYPDTAGTSGNVLVSDGTNWSSSATTAITALGAQAQALNMNTHLINNVVDPVSAQDAATKNYVDQNALNGTSVYAASAASLGTVTQSGAGVGATLTNAGAQATFALDGVNPPVGSNVLIKDTAAGMAAANEGIYTVTSVGSGATNWVLTRATSYDTATEINNTGLIVVQNGSTLAGTAWYNSSTIATVDTTAFNYVQFAQGKTLSVVAQVIPATATYTPTANMAYCIVEIVGGGGGGGGSASAGAGQGSGGGGGGGAGYCQKTYTAANIGANAAVVIGAAGAAGTAGTNNGGAGGNSTFTPSGTGATLTANGGAGGTGGTTSAAANSSGGGSGGTATNGDLNIYGVGAGTGWAIAAGVLVAGGQGGNSFLGNSWGMQAVVGNSAGLASNPGNYGAGGGGGASATADRAGGAGIIGVCYITEYVLT